jgi:hypothetical protein
MVPETHTIATGCLETQHGNQSSPIIYKKKNIKKKHEEKNCNM